MPVRMERGKAGQGGKGKGSFSQRGRRSANAGRLSPLENKEPKKGEPVKGAEERERRPPVATGETESQEKGGASEGGGGSRTPAARRHWRVGGLLFAGAGAAAVGQKAPGADRGLLVQHFK